MYSMSPSHRLREKLRVNRELKEVEFRENSENDTGDKAGQDEEKDPKIDNGFENNINDEATATATSPEIAEPWLSTPNPDVPLCRASPLETIFSPSGTPKLKPKGKEKTVTLISLDLPRTFPALSFFQV